MSREIEEDEIDLRVLFNIIWNKKVFVFIFTFIVTLLAILYVYSKTPIYEVESVLKIGSITTNGNTRQLESSPTLTNKINIIYNINIPKEELTRLSNISIIKGSVNLIKIKVTSTSNQEASLKLNSIVKSIREEHKIKINNYLKIMNDRLSLLNIEEKRFTEEIILLNENINKKENSINTILKSNPAVAAVYTMNLNAKTNELIELKNKAYELRNDISKIKIAMLSENIQETKILGDITKSKSPIKPKKILIIVVAFITGFILSIFLVFLMSFIKNLRQSIKNQ